MKRPKLFDQPIVQFFRPFACQEGDDLRSSVDEFRAVSPVGIHRVSLCHFLRVARVPTIFRQPNFLNGTLPQKGRHWRTCRHGCFSFDSIEPVLNCSRMDCTRPHSELNASSWVLPKRILLKTVATATTLGIRCTPNWKMRKLDLATIGPPEYCKFCGKLLKPKPLAVAIIFTRNHSFFGRRLLWRWCPPVV